MLLGIKHFWVHGRHLTITTLNSARSYNFGIQVASPGALSENKAQTLHTCLYTKQH
jgi:hypothetical protein